MISEIHSASDFEKEITDHKGYSLIDFWAAWCPPCRMMAPVLQKAEQEMGDVIHFTRADTDEMQQLAADFDIMSIPTLVIFKDGKEVGRLSGYRPLDALKADLQQILSDNQ